MKVDNEAIERLKEQLSNPGPSTPPPPRPPLNFGGEGGRFEDMEGRVSRLEAHVDVLRNDVSTIKNDVGTIKTDVATIRENVRHLPGKGFVVAATMAGLALFGAITVFADKIQAFLT